VSQDPPPLQRATQTSFCGFGGSFQSLCVPGREWGWGVLDFGEGPGHDDVELPEGAEVEGTDVTLYPLRLQPPPGEGVLPARSLCKEKQDGEIIFPTRSFNAGPTSLSLWFCWI